MVLMDRHCSDVRDGVIDVLLVRGRVCGVRTHQINGIDYIICNTVNNGDTRGAVQFESSVPLVGGRGQRMACVECRRHGCCCRGGGDGRQRWVVVRSIVHWNEDNVHECQRQNQRQQQTQDVSGVALVHAQEVSLVQHFHLGGNRRGGVREKTQRWKEIQLGEMRKEQRIYTGWIVNYVILALFGMFFVCFFCGPTNSGWQLKVKVSQRTNTQKKTKRILRWQRSGSDCKLVAVSDKQSLLDVVELNKIEFWLFSLLNIIYNQPKPYYYSLLWLGTHSCCSLLPATVESFSILDLMVMMELLHKLADSPTHHATLRFIYSLICNKTGSGRIHLVISIACREWCILQ